MVPMISSLKALEARRQAFPNYGNAIGAPARPVPTLWEWYVEWPLDDFRGNALWHVANAGVPAMLCRDLRWLREDWGRVRFAASYREAFGPLKMLRMLEYLSGNSMELEREGPWS